MPKGKNFQGRLRALQEKHGLTNAEMGFLFGIGASMFGQMKRGAYVSKEEGTMNRYLLLLNKLEKETDLQKYFSGIHESMPVRAGGDTHGIDYYIKENKILQDEIRSLKRSNQTFETTITFLHEEIHRLKDELQSIKRN